MIFVDASAFVAMILREPESDGLFNCMDEGEGFFTSPLAVYEAAVAVARSVNGGLAEAMRDVLDFLSRSAIQVIAIDLDVGLRALNAFERFGKGRHKARLNMGDCFAYAVAKSRNAAILFTGDDFTHTDLSNALGAP